MRTLILCPWFGPLPEWMPLYRRNIAPLPQRGFDFLIDNDLKSFVERVRRVLDIHCPIRPGTGKIHDYRAAFGELYAEEIKGYDWWGTTDFDCVYGRVERFYNDDLLEEFDVTTDCNDYICGPWTLYRNRSETASVFREHPDWRNTLRDPRASGWVETIYTDLLNATGLRIQYLQRHAYTDEFFLKKRGRRLTHFDVEVPYFHFRYSKRWPLSNP